MKLRGFLPLFLLFVSPLMAAEEDPNTKNEEVVLVFDESELLAQGEPGLPEVDLGPEEEDNVDPRVLRDFIESRGLIECRQKCGKLVIAGDVRARWTCTGEKVKGDKKRGFGTFVPINRFRSEMNLFLDYETPCSWVSTKLRWSQNGGRDGGSETKTELERAFIGYDIYMKKELDFYVELGRSKLDYIFDSRVQFSSFFDGIHLYYTDIWPRVGTFVIHGGPFVIDSLTNHYGWVLETYVTKWAGTGFTFKYSIIDWERFAPTFNYSTRGTRALTKNNPRYRFLVSQMLIGYERKIDFLGCKTLFLYGAALKNHAAQRTFTSNFKRYDQAWYAGFTLGKLCKACDWSLDINYQSVQAFAIPEFDLSGIGHGNADGDFFAQAVILSRFPKAAQGFTNYKGWQISLLYALTDTLSIRTKAEWSTPRNRSIGPDFFYKNFEMNFIYAF